MIKCTNGVDIVFSPEALDELIKDYTESKDPSYDKTN
jgi:hypothetical protein